MDVWFFDIGRYVVLQIFHIHSSEIWGLIQKYIRIISLGQFISKYNPPIFEERVIQYSFMNIFYISNVKKWGFFFSLG